jgi:phosphate transport system substrate-binding protein
MKKLHKQLFALVSVVLVFALFNFAIYHVFTCRVIHRYGEEMQAKSITLGEYLPFDEDSKIVKIDSDFSLSGDLPVIDGAAALYPMFSAFVNAVYPEDSVVFDGTDFSEESALRYHNTRGAYKGVVDGDIDIAICVAPSAEQMAYAEENGVGLCFVPIGREAFVFMVNKNNPVSDLTCDEVRGVYSGQYTNWKELGGENKRIGALRRNAGSGSQSALLNFMGDAPLVTDYDSFLGSAIGFSFRFYVEGIVEDGNVKMLALDGVYPDKENIKSGDYPIINEIYAVYRADNKNPNVKAMVEWMLSEEGQYIVETTGYVGVN